MLEQYGYVIVITIVAIVAAGVFFLKSKNKGPFKSSGQGKAGKPDPKDRR